MSIAIPTARPTRKVEYGTVVLIVELVALRLVALMKSPAQATFVEPSSDFGAPVERTLRPTVAKKRRSATVPPKKERGRRSREASQLILLIHAGWVGMALLIVTCIPTWKADFDKRTQPGVKGAVTFSPPAVDRLHSPPHTEQTLFVGGSDSLVARTVGHAEGTRTPDGRKTRAYYGHTDPGNGVWNLGSFSFQHCRDVRYHCATPEEADDRQLRRLQAQHVVLLQRAAAAKLQMTLVEQLNGIDLANQAPLAALSDQGYVDRLSQAKHKGFNGQNAILEARVWSYWSPQKKRWDAPGLGNVEPSIRHDQERRLLAIARAMTMAQQATGLQDSQRTLNLLKLQPEVVNPYTFSQQRSDYLWWDAGYWDAKLNQQRQVSPGYDPAYDRGFANGSSF